MNVLDIIVIAAFVLCVLGGYGKGFVLSFYSLIGSFLTLFLSWKLYPVIGKAIRNSPLYDIIFKSVKDHFKLEEAIIEFTEELQADFISGLSLPDFLKGALADNNNSVLYDMLGVSKFEDYICGYITNYCVNIISLIAAFIVVGIALRLIVDMLNITAKLPLLSGINRLGGAIVGIFQATLSLWIGAVVAVFFISHGTIPGLADQLKNATIAHWFFDNNPILSVINKVF